jgi:integrase
MRHTFATTALDAGVPLRDVQDSMGYRDPRTTRLYDRTREPLPQRHLRRRRRANRLRADLAAGERLAGRPGVTSPQTCHPSPQGYAREPQ